MIFGTPLQIARAGARTEKPKGKEFMYSVSEHWATVQPQLLPFLEDELGALGDDEKLFTLVAEELDLDAAIVQRRAWTGRPPASSVAIFKAFVFKAVSNFPT
ncbi:MAG: hypothetical protein IKS92_03585, partial [Victivallales bacterium]|nr:hypothetical protein [Victivallales bacterium]